MKRMNHLKRFAFLCMALMAVSTIVVAVSSKTQAKADGLFDWFEKVSVKKCAISLTQDTFDWTGMEIRPEVYVNYQGTELKKNVDYVVSYSNNVDAGTGKVIVEGKGNYKGKESISFRIKGIDFERECIVSIENKNVSVYYQNRLLTRDLDYWYNEISQAKLIQSVPAAGGKYLNTYDVTTYYTISGKGKFDGSVTKKLKTTEVKYENVTWTEPED